MNNVVATCTERYEISDRIDLVFAAHGCQGSDMMNMSEISAE